MYDVAIVGGGPAGASAATFTARAGLQTVLIDADAGMTRRAMVNNHLGFPEGVAGPDLVDTGKLQAAPAGVPVGPGTGVKKHPAARPPPPPNTTRPPSLKNDSM